MITKRDERFMENAFTISKGLPKIADQRIAAMLVISGKLISTGFNSNKKHPFALKYARDRNPDCQFFHAEVSCIHNASKEIDLVDFRRATLYIARAKKLQRNSSYTMGLAKPCNGCQRCIESFNIKKVIYTTDDLRYEELIY